jgi:bifunctional UDP-N-acetylglucosamine pyrophosphorylase/glucosamine-1-phosphate N-acetyltransferase
MAYRPLSAVVLAAGEGTRMRSERPKPLHRLCGRPMILHVLDALAELPVEQVVVVVGHRGDWVTKTLTEHAPSALAISFVEQPSLLGTADALGVGLTALPDVLDDSDGDVVVLAGDTPLVRPPTLAALVRHHRRSEAAATLLTAVVDDGLGLDRVVRAKDGTIARVDDPAAVGPPNPGDAAEGAGDEVATTIHCFRHGVLAPALRRIAPAGDPAEHRLTDVYAVLAGAGYRVESFTVDDPMETAGVNDRAQLAVAEAVRRDRINERWMRRGVTMWDPERTYVDTSVQLAADVVLLPGVILQGACQVEAGAEVGPDCHLVDTVVGASAVVTRTHATRAVVGTQARVGPFAVLGEGVVVPDGGTVPPFGRLDAAPGD